VIELPILNFKDAAHLFRVQEALSELQPIKQEFAKWGAKWLFSASIPSYELMGKKRVATLEDFNGLRVRSTGGMADALTKAGATAVVMPTPECYSALDRGVIDAVTMPWTYAFEAYKIHELSKYATMGLKLGTANAIVFCSIKSWNALPDDLKAIHYDLMKEMPKISNRAYSDVDAKNLTLFIKELEEIIYFPDEEREKLVKIGAGPVWEEWVKRMEAKRLPGREILDYTLKKIEEFSPR
jgi:TRAP-type C4-dicarboxylate transport system substrate-binding protein